MKSKATPPTTLFRVARGAGIARAFGALAFGALALGALGASCGSSPPTPQGAPVLKQVYWVAGGETLLAWTPPDAPSPSFVSPVPPFANEVDFVFDRLLDGDGIEDRVTVNGVPTTRPKDMPPVEVRWPDMATSPGDPPLMLQVAYNSAARFGGGTSYVFARPVPLGFPSDTTVTFILHPEGLTSTTGEPTTAPTEIPIKTAAFSATISPPTSPVAPKFQLPLLFSNRLPPVAAGGPFVHVRQGDADVPYKLLADASLISKWYLAPADCLGAWPAGASLVVTLDAGLPDAFGGKLGAAVVATFTTSPATAPAGATCAVVRDGGTADASDGGAPDASGEAGAGDGAVDGGGPDGGAPDGSGDGAADAGRDGAADAADGPGDAGTVDAADGSVDAADASPADAADVPVDAPDDLAAG